MSSLQPRLESRAEVSLSPNSSCGGDTGGGSSQSEKARSGVIMELEWVLGLVWMG